MLVRPTIVNPFMDFCTIASLESMPQLRTRENSPRAGRYKPADISNSSSSSLLRTLTENCSSLVQHGTASVCRNHLKRRKGILQPRGSVGFYEEYSVRNSRNLCRPTSAWVGNEMRGQGEDKRVSPCCGFLGTDRSHIMKRDSPIVCGEREETATQE